MEMAILQKATLTIPPYNTKIQKLKSKRMVKNWQTNGARIWRESFSVTWKAASWPSILFGISNSIRRISARGRGVGNIFTCISTFCNTGEFTSMTGL